MNTPLDYLKICLAPLVIDTRNATAGVTLATAAARPPLTTIIASAFFDLMFIEFSSGISPKPVSVDSNVAEG